MRYRERKERATIPEQNGGTEEQNGTEERKNGVQLF